MSTDDSRSTGTINVRFFGEILFLAAFVFASLSSWGCPICGTSDSRDTTSSQFLSKRSIQYAPHGDFVETLDPAPYQPGDTVKTKIGYQTAVQQFTWNPPAGAGEVRFKNVQPEAGGPPYVFKNIDLATAQHGIEIEYEAPTEGYASGAFRDSTEMVLPNGAKYLAEGVHAFARTALAATTSSPRLAAQPASVASPWQQVRVTDPITVPMWQQMRFIDTRGITMTTELCQDYVRNGQSANQFLAWRVPVSTTIVPGQAYVLPLVSTPAIAPTLSMFGFGAREFTVPLELRWDAMQWAEAHLPAATGEMWLALGVDRAQTLTCPDHLFLPADRWSFLLETTLNLSRLPAECDGCELTTFACYKTAASSTLAAALAAAGVNAGQARVYGTGVACLGPDETTLVQGPGWYLSSPTLLTSISATEPITVRHWVENYTGVTQTLTLELSSNLIGAAWRAYPSRSDNVNAPDLTALISAPITAAPGGRNVAGNNIWLLTEAPASASGAYTVALTLANPALNPPTSKKATSIWVGSWADPAPLTPTVAIGKSAAPAPVEPGGWLTYTLHITNTGPLPLHDLLITDTIPISTTFQSCLGADRCVQESETVRWELATLGAGLARSLKLAVRVAADAPVGGVLHNNNYLVTAHEGASAAGPAVETVIAERNRTIYLPLLLK